MRFLLNSLEICWQLSFTDQTSWPHRKQTPHTNSIKRLLYLAKKSLSHYSCRYLNISQVRTCLNQRRQKGSDNVQYLLVLSIKKVDLIKIYLHQSLSVLNWYLSLNEQFSPIEVLTERKKKNRWNSLVKKLNLGWTPLNELIRRFVIVHGQ